MTQRSLPPDIEKVKKRAERMQAICKRWDALILVTDDMIAQLEAQIRQQPNEIYRLKKAKHLLNIQPEKSE